MTDFLLWQLQTDSYLLIDKLSNYQQNPTNQSQGSWACRQLLIKFQQQFHQISLLQEQTFPYFFNTQQTRYFVSFSHSRERVAVLISPYQNIGVDIEDKMVSYQIVERFFHEKELLWLNSLSKQKQQIAIKLLWTLKESMIKTGLGESFLTIGLGVSMLEYFSQSQLEKLLFNEYWQIEMSDKTVGFLVDYDCGFVLGKSSILYAKTE